MKSDSTWQRNMSYAEWDERDTTLFILIKLKARLDVEMKSYVLVVFNSGSIQDV